MTRRLLCAAAALALVLAGCGGDDDDEPAAAAADETTTTTSGDDEATSTSGGDDASAGADGSVTVVDFTFEPGTVEVAAGTAVTWTNEDGVPHTVTAGTPDARQDTFDEPLDPGGTAEVTFEEAGTFAYFCAIHTSMTGEVVVS